MNYFNSFLLYVLFFLLLGEYVFWSDGSKIYKLEYYQTNPEALFYQPSNGSISDIKVVDEYLYFIRKSYDT